MQLLNRILLKVFAGVMIIAPTAMIFPQDRQVEKTKKESEVRQFILDKRFQFIAQSATPLSGRTIQLTSSYGVRVISDSVISDLPYFGRAYSAPINPAQGGIVFTSVQFDYSGEEGKKGNQEILIQPKDAQDVRQMFFIIYTNGYSTLQVTSNNRQMISFYGYITEIKKICRTQMAVQKNEGSVT